jgi:RNA polymerase Rpb6
VAGPFKELDEAGVTEKEQELKRSIEASFARLEEFFAELEQSDARSIPLPGGPLPTLSAPYELATVHALRALQLAEGAARLLESNNYLAVYPVTRALFETWAALSYAAGQRTQRSCRAAVRLRSAAPVLSR